MLYHAVRASKRALPSRASPPEPANVWSGSAFTTVLQVAAARAWARTAVRNLRTASASTPSTSGEENTSRTKKPLSGFPSDADPRSWSNERQIFATPGSSSTWVDDDPLVDSEGSSSKRTRPPAYPTTPKRPTGDPTLPNPCVRPVNLQSVYQTAPNSHISPEVTKIRLRTPNQKPRRHIPYLRHLAGLPDSTTPLDLLNKLDEWRRRPPKPAITSFRSDSPPGAKGSPKLNFESLHAYHTRFPALQTHRSFRVLAEIAINEAKFEAVRRLWIEMNRKRMLRNWDSLDDGGVSMRAVWVRWMVRQGKWVKAWKTIERWRSKKSKISDSRLASEGLPHAIWLEFLGKAHESVNRLPSSRSGSQTRRCPTNGEHPNVLGLEDGQLGLEEQYRLLMRQPPHRNHSQLTNVRTRTVYALVRARLRLGDRKLSMDIIRDWFERTGSEKAKTDTKGNLGCLRLLNLYLALAFPLRSGEQVVGSGVPKGFTSVRKMEGVIGELMKLNPRVKPNSTTVLLLLRHLRSSSKCADNGVQLVTRCKRLYGDVVDDARVRLRLASYAVKQNNLKVFRKVLVSPSTATSVGWNEVALVRRRARLMRKRSSWLHSSTK